jgi:hypothetical protein
MKETAKMRQCLPDHLTQILDSALANMTDVAHHQFLMATALDQLLLEFDTGVAVCDAFKSMLQRLVRRHEHAIKQYAAAGTELQQAETIRQQLKNAHQTMSCSTKLRGKSFVPCMRLIQKEATIKMLVYYL